MGSQTRYMRVRADRMESDQIYACKGGHDGQSGQIYASKSGQDVYETGLYSNHVAYIGNKNNKLHNRPDWQLLLQSLP